eukprot:1177263-Prorocentrum_minimum.AAC.7
MAQEDPSSCANNGKDAHNTPETRTTRLIIINMLLSVARLGCHTLFKMVLEDHFVHAGLHPGISIYTSLRSSSSPTRLGGTRLWGGSLFLNLHVCWVDCSPRAVVVQVLFARCAVCLRRVDMRVQSVGELSGAPVVAPEPAMGIGDPPQTGSARRGHGDGAVRRVQGAHRRLLQGD